MERNTIYEAIAASGLSPNECTFNLNDRGLTLKHEGGSTVRIQHRDVGGMWRYDVRRRIVDGTNDFRIEQNIEEVVPIVQEWADEVKYVSETPDYWTEMQRNRELIADIQQIDSGNTPFTEDERRQITAQLQEIKTQLAKRFELTREQIEQITEKLDEAEDASKRMGRKDWFIYFLGTISALTIAATVAPGVGEHIFTMFIHALGHLFTGGSEPPQILA